MKILFTTLGCKLNFAESSSLGSALLERGHTRVQQGEEADICIINTCHIVNPQHMTMERNDKDVLNSLKQPWLSVGRTVFQTQ